MQQIVLSKGDNLDDGRYVVESETRLGRGGAGHVYLVRQTGLDILRAMKVLVPEHLDRVDEYQETFKREVQNLSKLTHNNIIKIIDYNSTGIAGHPYFIMEYADGGPLESAMQNLSSKEQLLSVLLQILDGLAYAHRFGLYHGDIKPTNILYRQIGDALSYEVKISDLGVSKLRMTLPTLPEVFSPLDNTLVWGTSKYAAPEIREFVNKRRPVPLAWLQERFETLDIYSLGVTLAELVSENPLSSEASTDLINDLLGTLHPKVTNVLDSKEQQYLRKFVRTLSAHHAGDRYPSIEKAKAALLRIEPKHIAFSAIPDLTGVGCQHEITGSYGRVKLSEAAFRWVNHPTVQRLHNLNQLNFVYLIYPSAKHSRFTHSLAAFQTAREFALHLLNDSSFRFLVDEGDLSTFLATSLLHDIGHYPLAHAIEELRPNFPPKPLDLAHIQTDYEMAEYFLKYSFQTADGQIHTPLWDILEKDGINPLRLLNLINKGKALTPADSILRILLDGSIDIDKIAYLTMDSELTGVSYGQGIDLDGLLPALRIVLPYDDAYTVSEPRIAILPEGISAAESVITARYHMYDRVYWHRTNRAVMSMLTYVARRLFNSTQPVITFEEYIGASINMTDHEAMQWLSKKMDKAIREGVFLNNSARPPGNPLQGLAGENRMLHKRLISISHPLDDEIQEYLTKCTYEELEELRLELLSVVGAALPRFEVQDDEVLLDVPRKRLAREARLQDLYVLNLRNRKVEEFSRYSEITLAVQQQYHHRANKCRLFVSNRISDECRSHSTLSTRIYSILREKAER